MQLSEVNALSAQNVEDPYAQYAVLRDEAPVHWDANVQAFLVSRYADVRAVLLDADLYSSKVGAITAPPALEAIEILNRGIAPTNTLITADAPEHTRYRQIVARAFTPRRVEKLRGDITALAVAMADAFAKRGYVELLDEFAAPFPLTVIADQLGVPRDRIHDFKRWSDAWMDFIGGLASQERSIQCANEIIECQEYFKARIDAYRADPPDDMLGVLIRAQLGGERPLSDPEITSILQQFMLAGNETSTASIAATWRFLVEQPDVLAAVDADRSLIPNVMEEIFRLESPVQNIFRISTRDTEIAGVKIPANTRIGVMFGSANRDPRAFPDPERIDPKRPNIREHLAFGQGNHYCVGAGLARLEGAIALDVLLDRLRGARFTPGRNDFKHNPIFIARSLRALHLDFDPA